MYSNIQLIIVLQGSQDIFRKIFISYFAKFTNEVQNTQQKILRKKWRNFANK